jgi:FkbM family methyltransferase
MLPVICLLFVGRVGAGIGSKQGSVVSLVAPPPAPPPPSHKQRDFPAIFRPSKACPISVAAAKADAQQFHSQSREDVFMLEQLFSSPRPMCQGTFIEMGALDGSLFSNSWFFEQVLDWRGIRVEAQPNLAKKAVEKRPLAAVWAGAVCPLGTKSVTFMGGGTGMSAVGAVKGMTNADHIKNYHLEDQPSFEVECWTMPEIIRESGLSHIDFWSLDVEGAELIVLSTMDWAIPVHYVLVETWEGRDGDYEKIAKLLADNGFVNERLKSTGYCCYRNTGQVSRIQVLSLAQVISPDPYNITLCTWILTPNHQIHSKCDCAKNTLFVNPNYGQHVWDAAQRNWTHLMPTQAPTAAATAPTAATPWAAQRVQFP